MGPRLVSRGKAESIIQRGWGEMLQWGRDLLVAESRSWSMFILSPPPASMGPRLVSRGKNLEVVPEGKEYPELQWGRDLLVAESSNPAGGFAH